MDGGSPFGHRLRALRRAAGLRQRELAAASGVSEVTISELERGGRRTARADTAAMLADALDLAGEEREAFLRLADRQRPARRRDGAWTAPPPAPVGPTFGREQDLDRLLDLLADPATRLVTLLGPGGIGKTRLAQEAARRVAASGERDVLWVDLSNATDATEVLPQIARAAGVSERPGAPLPERIASALRDLPLLLLLDNLEHLLDAVPEIAALVDAAPGIITLVTSREALRLTHERTLPLAPLPLPDQDADRAKLAANPAVALFLDRLGASRASAGPDETPVADAARVVTLVDGLPLAIELAAAQGAGLSAGAVADLLEIAGLRALDDGLRTGPARFRTMEQAIRWSHDLLDPSAQRLLTCVGVFRGGFGLPEIQEVAGPDAAALPRLLRASLLRETTNPGEPTRLAPLEPIRLFAVALLDQAPDAAAIRDAHAAAYLAVAKRAAAGLLAPEPDEALATFKREHANVLAALAHATATDGAAAAALALSLCWWWHASGRAEEAAPLLARVAAADAAAPASDRLLLRWHLGQFSGLRGNADAQATLFPEIAALAAQVGTPLASGLAHLHIGSQTLSVQADPTAVTPHLEAAVADLAKADPSPFLAHALFLRGYSRLERGEPEAALGDLERSVAAWGELGAALFVPAPRHHVAETLALLGRVEEARAQYLASLDLADRFDAPVPVVLNLNALAALAATTRPETAARLLGASDALVERHGLAYDAQIDARNAATRERLRDLLGTEAARLERLGRALPTHEAISLAVETLS